MFVVLFLARGDRACCNEKEIILKVYKVCWPQELEEKSTCQKKCEFYLVALVVELSFS